MNEAAAVDFRQSASFLKMLYDWKYHKANIISQKQNCTNTLMNDKSINWVII